MKDWVQELLSRYTYNPRAGKELTPTVTIFKGVQHQTNQPVTIKIVNSPAPELFNYLQKLKDVTSDYVIKIIDMATNSSKTVVICEDSPYGNLATALAKCRRLEDSDAVFMAKSIIDGHIDLMRDGVRWFGGFGDIDITETGVKLSWNGAEIKQENPIPKLIERLNARDPAEEKGLLPFPKNRQILELAKVAEEGALEMSIHPLLKKRDKVFKKKGKGWIALKQTKNKSEYFQETVYLAVSPSSGFIRVKMYQKGKIDKDALILNKTKNSFVKVLDEYDEGSKTFIISEYANDGNLQQYVTKLKGSNVQLKEDQIQFFLYSLVEPIKSVQMSPLMSVNCLHIKNIWVENGIPKIGEPVPMTPKIFQLLKDRYDVPDFYHRVFKNNPTSHDPSYDTYSLGVLLYKLMYTEYPIFPEGKVHIPSAPQYNTRIKTTLRIFLDEGGTLSNIESRLDISESVKRQIQENKAKLDQKPRNYRDEIENIQSVQQIEVTKQQTESKQPKQKNCWSKLTEPLEQSKQGRKTKSFFIDCQTSRLRNYRICTKIIISVLFYILLFYFWYLNRVFDLFVKTSAYSAINVTVSGLNYTIVTSDSSTFSTAFNATASKDYSAITNTLKCVVDSTDITYSNYINANSAGWVLYLSLSLVLFAMFILFKVFQIGWFDLIHTIFNYETKRYHFNISTFITFNLVFCLGLYTHYFVFQYVFDAQVSPCFGGDQSLWYGSTTSLMKDRSYFNQNIVPLALVVLILVVLAFVQVVRHEKIPYSRLVNPIALLCPFLIVLTIVVRVGVFSAFTPSWLSPTIFTNQLSTGNYVALFGFIPELLVLIQLSLTTFVDWIFWKCQKRKDKVLVHDMSMSEEFRDGKV